MGVKMTGTSTCIPLLLIAYSTSVHKTTGCIPAKVMLGRNLHLPVDLIYRQPEEEGPSLATDYVESLKDWLEKVRYARPHTEGLVD